MGYSNPVIPGFYPDPSACRVGTDYYLVTSTFEYFPGVPIFHSRDLVNWQQIGHCLTRPSQLPLTKAASSAGIFAPTIRYHDGLFYMIVTNVSVGKNFIVSAQQPEGEWSEPVWLEGGGIDPSLFFDDDGKVYFMTTGNTPNGIYQCEIDLKTGRFLTDLRLIWTGTGGRYPEAPHMYKIGDYYYLMIAEGGTEYGHMETIARSHSPWGDFTPCPRNPILTHSNRAGHPIQATGHADLIQAHDGSWWLIFLAFRTLSQHLNYHHIGRETFLAPVSWDEDGWPIVNHDGTVELEMHVDPLPAYPCPPEPIRDDFDARFLNFNWNFLRNPSAEQWSLTDRPGWLRLKGSAMSLNDVDTSAFVGRRQRHLRCQATTLLDFMSTQPHEEAGLTVYMSECHHYEIAITGLAASLGSGKTRRVIVRRRIGDLCAIVAEVPIAEGMVTLQIEADVELYSFRYSLDGQSFHTLATGAARYLSSEVAGGFTGVYFAMYATGNGKPALAPADFDWFDYMPR